MLVDICSVALGFGLNACQIQVCIKSIHIPIYIPFPRLQITKCHVIMCNGLTLQCLGCAPSQNECVTLIALQPCQTMYLIISCGLVAATLDICA